ncbi:hypothetical protein [Xanthomonas arboricola]|uniref:hypothetical protein n=1 Tax=Xanthomonas arboricola TaxID=56448 RepID=UPI000CB99FBC|nr:hypothetical protein [Xanthomonas arboricola]SOU07323.1 hypothetical protein LMG19144_02384 [Xanthomonas arboricola pv. fragariae]
MISAPMVRTILEQCKWDENKITKEILIPCLERYSASHNHCLREIRFTGGAHEFGNDIEFYELSGPDQFRLYTGIQVKKGKIDQSQATMLANQGSQAFAKSILDPAINQSNRITRWVAATTGEVTAPAADALSRLLRGDNRLVHVWDGLKIAQLIFDNYLPEFLKLMEVWDELKYSTNVTNMMYDPDERLVIAQSLVPGTIHKLDLSGVAPPGIANGAFLILEPDTDKLRNLMCTIQSDMADMVVDAVASRFSPVFIPFSENSEISIKFEDDRAVTIICRGYRFSR